MLTRQQIPNLLTFARVAAVPISLALMLLAPRHATPIFWIFLAAALTDYLDGYLARRWNAITPLGTMLDQISDKLLVATMLLYLLLMMGLPLLLPVAVIILRELYISGLREFLALRAIALPVSKSGKWKTALQMAAITLLLGTQAFNPPYALNFKCSAITDSAGHLVTSCANQPLLIRAADIAGLPLLYAAVALALLSAVAYTRAATRSMRAAKKNA
ncbi:MAG: CDP-diacylglycerol--glycerol-3-phosphate 3-phosphatidyltransferase [Pseudomonadota bacterium]